MLSNRCSSREFLEEWLPRCKTRICAAWGECPWRGIVARAGLGSFDSALAHSRLAQDDSRKEASRRVGQLLRHFGAVSLELDFAGSDS